MKKSTKIKTENATANGITSWLSLNTVFVIIATVLSFLFVETTSKYIWETSGDSYSIWGHALGLIFPMCVLVGAINFYVSKIFFRYISTLIDGIEKVSQGDFSIKLDVKKAGPLLDVYKNFNKMGEELEKVQMLRNDFLNNYSHEFKTPITSINGFASLLLETEVTEDERMQYLRIIADESARLANLANSTILMSKLGSQEIVQNKKSYSLDEQLRQCAIITSGAWQEKNIDFVSDLQPITYIGNAELLQHLWLNLINNAVKYTPNGGKIMLSLKTEATAVVVSVSDTGVGMDEETIAHIFEKYYQVDKTHSKQGLGLGLSIVKKVVDLAEGKIEVRSTKGSGSTFTVTLPK